MSDLFPTTTQELPALERARRAYQQASDAYDADPENNDLWAAKSFAADALKEAELDELQRLRK